MQFPIDDSSLSLEFDSPRRSHSDPAVTPREVSRAGTPYPKAPKQLPPSKIPKLAGAPHQGCFLGSSNSSYDPGRHHNHHHPPNTKHRTSAHRRSYHPNHHLYPGHNKSTKYLGGGSNPGFSHLHQGSNIVLSTSPESSVENLAHPISPPLLQIFRKAPSARTRKFLKPHHNPAIYITKGIAEGSKGGGKGGGGNRRGSAINIRTPSAQSVVHQASINSNYGNNYYLSKSQVFDREGYLQGPHSTHNKRIELHRQLYAETPGGLNSPTSKSNNTNHVPNPPNNPGNNNYQFPPNNHFEAGDFVHPSKGGLPPLPPKDQSKHRLATATLSQGNTILETHQSLYYEGQQYSAHSSRGSTRGSGLFSPHTFSNNNSNNNSGRSNPEKTPSIVPHNSPRIAGEKFSVSSLQRVHEAESLTNIHNNNSCCNSDTNNNSKLVNTTSQYSSCSNNNNSKNNSPKNSSNNNSNSNNYSPNPSPSPNSIKCPLCSEAKGKCHLHHRTMCSRYMTDLEWRICHAVNIYVYKNGEEGQTPVLIHIPPGKKRNMRSVMQVIQERISYPIGYAKYLYRMNGKKVTNPCELEMYNNYVVASNYDKCFKCVCYARRKSPLLVLAKESKHVRELRLKNYQYELYMAKRRCGEERQVGDPFPTDPFYGATPTVANPAPQIGAGFRAQVPAVTNGPKTNKPSRLCYPDPNFPPLETFEFTVTNSTAPLKDHHQELLKASEANIMPPTPGRFRAIINDDDSVFYASKKKKMSRGVLDVSGDRKKIFFRDSDSSVNVNADSDTEEQKRKYERLYSTEDFSENECIKVKSIKTVPLEQAIPQMKEGLPGKYRAAETLHKAGKMNNLTNPVSTKHHHHSHDTNGDKKAKGDMNIMEFSSTREANKSKLDNLHGDTSHQGNTKPSGADPSPEPHHPGHNEAMGEPLNRVRDGDYLAAESSPTLQTMHDETVVGVRSRSYTILNLEGEGGGEHSNGTNNENHNNDSNTRGNDQCLNPAMAYYTQQQADLSMIVPPPARFSYKDMNNNPLLSGGKSSGRKMSPDMSQYQSDVSLFAMNGGGGGGASPSFYLARNQIATPYYYASSNYFVHPQTATNSGGNPGNGSNNKFPMQQMYPMEAVLNQRPAAAPAIILDGTARYLPPETPITPFANCYSTDEVDIPFSPMYHRLEPMAQFVPQSFLASNSTNSLNNSSYNFQQVAEMGNNNGGNYPTTKGKGVVAIRKPSRRNVAIQMGEPSTLDASRAQTQQSSHPLHGTFDPAPVIISPRPAGQSFFYPNPNFFYPQPPTTMMTTNNKSSNKEQPLQNPQPQQDPPPQPPPPQQQQPQPEQQSYDDSKQDRHLGQQTSLQVKGHATGNRVSQQQLQPQRSQQPRTSQQYHHQIQQKKQRLSNNNQQQISPQQSSQLTPQQSLHLTPQQSQQLSPPQTHLTPEQSLQLSPQPSMGHHQFQQQQQIQLNSQHSFNPNHVHHPQQQHPLQQSLQHLQQKIIHHQQQQSILLQQQQSIHHAQQTILLQAQQQQQQRQAQQQKQSQNLSMKPSQKQVINNNCNSSNNLQPQSSFQQPNLQQLSGNNNNASYNSQALKYQQQQAFQQQQHQPIQRSSHNNLPSPAENRLAHAAPTVYNMATLQSGPSINVTTSSNNVDSNIPYKSMPQQQPMKPPQQFILDPATVVPPPTGYRDGLLYEHKSSRRTSFNNPQDNGNCGNSGAWCTSTNTKR